MNVVRLNGFRGGDTEILFRKLLTEAKASEIDGVVLSFRRKDGSEESFFTGLYKADPEKALSAAMRLSWRLTQLLDDSST